LGKEFVRTEKIPLYLNGVKVFGNEPPQIEPSPTPSDGPAQHRRRLKSLHWSSVQIRRYNGSYKRYQSSIKIKNTGTKPVNLSDVKVRYWFTKDGASSQEFVCDYAHLSESMITAKFVDLENPVENADNYLEIGFDSNAGILGPGSDTGEIQFRIVKEIMSLMINPMIIPAWLLQKTLPQIRTLRRM